MLFPFRNSTILLIEVLFALSKAFRLYYPSIYYPKKRSKFILIFITIIVINLHYHSIHRKVHTFTHAHTFTYIHPFFHLCQRKCGLRKNYKEWQVMSGVKSQLISHLY